MISLDELIKLTQLKNALTNVKTYVDNRVSALATSVSDVMEDVDSSITALETNMETKGNCEILLFFNKEVTVSEWVSDTTYSKYPYRASIVCDKVTVNHVPDVSFSVDDAESLNYSNTSQTANDMVYIYAKEKPSTSIVIPTIECRRAVN